MKSVIIVQARTGSSRFPNKVMREINGIPIIELLLKRLTQSKKAQKIVVATTTNKKDDKLYCALMGHNINQACPEKSLIKRTKE